MKKRVRERGSDKVTIIVNINNIVLLAIMVKLEK